MRPPLTRSHFVPLHPRSLLQNRRVVTGKVQKFEKALLAQSSKARKRIPNRRTWTKFLPEKFNENVNESGGLLKAAAQFVYPGGLTAPTALLPLCSADARFVNYCDARAVRELLQLAGKDIPKRAADADAEWRKNTMTNLFQGKKFVKHCKQRKGEVFTGQFSSDGVRVNAIFEKTREPSAGYKHAREKVEKVDNVSPETFQAPEGSTLVALDPGSRDPHCGFKCSITKRRDGET